MFGIQNIRFLSSGQTRYLPYGLRNYTFSTTTSYFVTRPSRKPNSSSTMITPPGALATHSELLIIAFCPDLKGYQSLHGISLIVILYYYFHDVYLRRPL